jgi:hypothetical protein
MNNVPILITLKGYKTMLLAPRAYGIMFIQGFIVISASLY